MATQVDYSQSYQWDPSWGQQPTEGQEQPQEQIRPPNIIPNKLYVGNIPDGVSKDTLTMVFERFGSLTALLYEKESAVVIYDEAEDAKAAVAALDYFDIHGSRITLCFADEQYMQHANEVLLPNACFRCGQQGHPGWECMNLPFSTGESQEYYDYNSGYNQTEGSGQENPKMEYEPPPPGFEISDCIEKKEEDDDE
ncbi:hypothetical protein CAPTEDRAFT_222353 [Capitella teleta]|uniref:RRM domain-containing protein n=1 Tax=Capitella teleta TaxID=283909 RepID=R7TZY8_CAPTE|nr:hypothetical protein CAPTEDRAFT_222353 [Capitella teleta]|eukprot:ELT99518.1 hypothetical protein CAPTEDRAFT_222353 [Capitella teleta]